PGVPFAETTAEVARPLAFVVAVFTPPANVALAPVAGGVNVTTTPGSFTGFPALSATCAPSGAPKAVLIAALCPDPLGHVSSAAADVFVSMKSAGAATPATVAVTV